MIEWNVIDAVECLLLLSRQEVSIINKHGRKQWVRFGFDGSRRWRFASYRYGDILLEISTHNKEFEITVSDFLLIGEFRHYPIEFDSSNINIRPYDYDKFFFRDMVWEGDEKAFVQAVMMEKMKFIPEHKER